MKPNKSEREYHVSLTQPFKNCLSSVVCEDPGNSNCMEGFTELQLGIKVAMWMAAETLTRTMASHFLRHWASSLLELTGYMLKL